MPLLQELSLRGKEEKSSIQSLRTEPNDSLRDQMKSLQIHQLSKEGHDGCDLA